MATRRPAKKTSEHIIKVMSTGKEFSLASLGNNIRAPTNTVYSILTRWKKNPPPGYEVRSKKSDVGNHLIYRLERDVSIAFSSSRIQNSETTKPTHVSNVDTLVEAASTLVAENADLRTALANMRQQLMLSIELVDEALSTGETDGQES